MKRKSVILVLSFTSVAAPVLNRARAVERKSVCGMSAFCGLNELREAHAENHTNQANHREASSKHCFSPMVTFIREEH